MPYYNNVYVLVSYLIVCFFSPVHFEIITLVRFNMFRAVSIYTSYIILMVKTGLNGVL